jgi:hypothetical protein
MSARPAHKAFELPEITRHDRARFVKDARRLRAEQFDRLFRSAGRGLARLSRGVVALVASPRPVQGGTGKA